MSLQVYSGRRGIHCWVADQRARRLSSNYRDGIANFINIFEGGQFKAKKIEIDGSRGIHPSVSRSVIIIDKYFDQLMVKNQDFLNTPNQIEMIINLCQNEILRNELKNYLLNPAIKTTAERWKMLTKISHKFYNSKQFQVEI